MALAAPETAPAESTSPPRSAVFVALQDIAEVADAAGAAVMEVFLDERQHGAQSLLQPGLAAMQGPALCIRIPGAPQPPNAWQTSVFGVLALWIRSERFLANQARADEF